MRKIYANGHFYTFNSRVPKVEAVVVENGRFIDMGSMDEIFLQWGKANIIDLEGKTVTPGLVDSHLHLSLIADYFITLDLTGTDSKYGMLEKIKERAGELAPGQWLLGGGWDENLFTDGGIPTIAELDHAAPENPLLFTRVCQHAAIVNSQALLKSGFHPSNPVPEGGVVVLDETSNQPTGLLLESAMDLVKGHIPAHSDQILKNAMRKTIQFAMEKGLTSVHTNDPLYLGGLEPTWKLYDELLNGEQLGLRCNLLINHEYIPELKAAGMYSGYGNDVLQIGAVKIFADGAFGRRTALLSQPYSDDSENVGEAMYSQEQMTEIIKRARELDMPVAVHAIGDQALENVLDVLDQFPVVSFRDRLIHTQVLRPELLTRLAQGNRIVDIQPRFLASDFPWAIERLGKERSRLSYAWKSLLDAGVICAGGSDAPVEPIDPLFGIHAAVTRKKPGQQHSGFYPEQKLSMEQAFRLFTEFGAFPTNEEKEKGTMARGKFADMTVFSANPFEMVDADELLTTEVEMTIIGGNVKFHKN